MIVRHPVQVTDPFESDTVTLRTPTGAFTPTESLSVTVLGRTLVSVG